jgi:hypothetical protein
MTEAEKLAALDRAATQGDEADRFFAESELQEKLLRLYRANQLVLIGPDAVEKAINRINEIAIIELEIEECDPKLVYFNASLRMAIAALTGRV